MSQFKAFMLNIDSLSLVYASEEEEFYYKDDTIVPEGEVVGIEVENEDSIDIVLFSNIYFTHDVI